MKRLFSTQIRVIVWALVFIGLCTTSFGQSPRFRIVALSEAGGIHAPFVAEAKKWLAKLTLENNITVDYIENTQAINSAFLAKYSVFIQLNYPPYMWTDTAKAAFQQYIEAGRLVG